MFTTNDTQTLRRQLDRFTIPMFIAQLDLQCGEYRILALNEAHEAQSGMQMSAVTDKTLSTLLPPEQAENSAARYSECLRSDAPVRYREQLQLPSGTTIWDTSLCKLELPDGGARIVGTALVVRRIKRDTLDTLAFQDVNYFAATSTMRLTQISDVLAAIEEGRIAPEKLVGAAGMLAALCRSVNETLEELRSIATKRLADQPDAVPLISVAQGDVPQPDCAVERAVQALVSVVEELPQEDTFAQAAVSSAFIDDYGQRRQG